MQQQTFKNSSQKVGLRPSTVQPHVQPLKKSPTSSEQNIVISFPEYVPSDGELMADEFPEETQQKYWK